MTAPIETKVQLLAACTLNAEFLNVKNIVQNLKQSKKKLCSEPAQPDPKKRRVDPRYHDPLRVGPPRRPIGPPGFFGEPDNDGFLPPNPDWERDRNPGGFLPGTDPFGGMPPTNPFNPRGPGNFGPRYL
eukprot:TRINITY_DN10260_c0_g1_i1.p1 TRINITY_DN10260_c0_g1~~TRINITY_DN10260_c0_g1_i1.p1  ORF type:complete len:129 (-),score=12.71 TRINITY_DN10260_c0_g1_i1:108-494(-)